MKAAPNTLQTLAPSGADRLGDSRDAWGLNRRRDPSAGDGVVSQGCAQAFRATPCIPRRWPAAPPAPPHPACVGKNYLPRRIETHRSAPSDRTWSRWIFLRNNERRRLLRDPGGLWPWCRRLRPHEASLEVASPSVDPPNFVEAAAGPGHCVRLIGWPVVLRRLRFADGVLYGIAGSPCRLKSLCACS
jgi:hypothetical protein